MPLVQHLIELRKRLMRAAIGVLVGGVAGWFLNDIVLNALRNPLLAGGKASERFSKLNFTGITSAFDVKFEIAIVLGIVVSSPIWLYRSSRSSPPRSRAPRRSTSSASSSRPCRSSSSAARRAGCSCRTSSS
jgi:Sec-independent protein secretion pathway component TatC